MKKHKVILFVLAGLLGHSGPRTPAAAHCQPNGRNNLKMPKAPKFVQRSAEPDLFFVFCVIYVVNRFSRFWARM